MGKPNSYQEAGYRVPQEPLMNAPKKQRKASNHKKHRVYARWVWLLMYGGCAVVFITCAALLVQYFSDIASTKATSAELRAIYEEDSQTLSTALPTQQPTALPTKALVQTTGNQPVKSKSAAEVKVQEPDFASYWSVGYPDNPHLFTMPPFLDLLEKNKDIVGWLKIEGVLNEPVVQRDNKFYLTHNDMGKKSVTGALFLDENCNLRLAPMRLLIHGHNMKEGAMFGALKMYKVKDASFYKQHPFIEFNTLYEQAKYVIFSVMEVDIRSDKPRFFPFWDVSDFIDRYAFDACINTARSYSHYNSKVEVLPGDRLLTLATCLGEDDSKRLVIMARKLRPNEDMLALNAAIYSTGNH
ncbi:MAG: class B sortase [Clostridia bacterium]